MMIFRSDFIYQNIYINRFENDNSWTILNSIEKSIKEKVEKLGIPLKNWDIQINYGIKTGFNEAFIIDRKTRDELIEANQKNEEIIRPILRGRDIKRFGYENPDLWLLYIPWHFPLHNDPNITGASEIAENNFKALYPAIYNHLLKYKIQLSNRNKAETGIRYEWYALQRWGSNYKDDFFKQKIIFQEMVQEPCFSLDEEGKFFCLDTARIITGNDLDFLVAIFNSKLFFFCIKNFYGGGGLGENGVRMKHTFFNNFPMPSLSEDAKNKIISIVQQILAKSPLEKDHSQEIDIIINESYAFSKEEIDFINNSF